MKPLTGEDLMKAMRLVKVSGLRDEVVKAASKANKGADLFEIGAGVLTDMFFCLVEPKEREMMWDLLSQPFEMTAEEVKKLPLGQLSAMLEELFKQEDTMAFIERLSRMITSE